MSKILVIEDDINIIQLIKDFLEAEGFEVYTSSNGEDGIVLARNIVPDLIICDILMPGISGFDVISCLAKEKATAVIPFIFLSAKVERTDVRQGMNLGADDYLTKPFKLDELLNAIDIRLRKKALLENQRPETPPVNADSGREKLDEDAHIFILVKNQPLFLKINSIECISSEAEYSYVYTNKGDKFLVRKLLKEWEEILPDKSFIRIHRSTIINLNYVQKVEKWFNNAYVVYLQNIKESFSISRRYAMSLKAKLHYT
ncbi:MAG: LytR/AlgR family response regulator transcription factor [Ignavibacteriales bacterium]